MFLYLLKQTFRALGILVVLLLLIRGFIIEPGRINGQSMETTFMDNDFFFINKYTLLLRAPKRGDIVQAIDPLSKRLVVKRVIGLPGEQLSIHDGGVYLRDIDSTETKISEQWLDADEWTTSAEGNAQIYILIPEHAYFLIGDNRDHSTDSRVYGAVHRTAIYGLVINPPF